MEQVQEITLFHTVIAVTIAAIFGFFAHIVRAVFNVFPDKLSDSPALNIAVSNDYSLADYLWGAEFDTYGYYKLNSIKNLRISMISSALGVLAIMFFFPDHARGIIELLNLSWVWIVDYCTQQWALIVADYS